MIRCLETNPKRKGGLDATVLNLDNLLVMLVSMEFNPYKSNSGGVPVKASSPSLVVATLRMKREEKEVTHNLIENPFQQESMSSSRKL